MLGIGNGGHAATGIDWGQLLVTLIAVVGGMSAFASVMFTRIDKRRLRITAAFSKTIHDVTDPLLQTLGTISTTLSRLTDRQDEQGERLSRVEGTLHDVKRQTDV